MKAIIVAVLAVGCVGERPEPPPAAPTSCIRDGLYLLKWYEIVDVKDDPPPWVVYSTTMYVADDQAQFDLSELFPFDRVGKRDAEIFARPPILRFTARTSCAQPDGVALEMHLARRDTAADAEGGFWIAYARRLSD